MSGRRLTLLAHGEPGSGKSWLINSAPKPLLLIDAEGRAEYLADLVADPTGMTPQKLVPWDPRNPVPEASADPDAVTVVSVKEYGDMELAYRWLERGDHPFRSLGVDSITEIQQRLIDKIAGIASMQTQDWGDALRQLEKMVRNLRDLRKHPTNPLWAVVVVSGSDEKNKKQRPMLQGQLAAKIAHHFDVVGYQQKRLGPDGDKQRLMLIDGYVDGISAKDDTHVLSHHYGDTILNPNISAMLRVLNPTPETSGDPAEGVTS